MNVEDLAKRSMTLFNSLTENKIVSEPEEAIVMSKESPFNLHLYCSLIIADVAIGSNDDYLFEHNYKPAIEALVESMSGVAMLEVQSLQMPDERTGCIGWTFDDQPIPVRFVATYDMIVQGVRVTFDMLARHVGNHYRTIINGPLHRHEMPFQYYPSNTLDYKFYPWNTLDYSHEVLIEETSETPGDSQWVTLPDLDPKSIRPSSLHHYKVDGKYCYYTGETLNI